MPQQGLIPSAEFYSLEQSRKRRCGNFGRQPKTSYNYPGFYKLLAQASACVCTHCAICFCFIRRRSAALVGVITNK